MSGAGLTTATSLVDQAAGPGQPEAQTSVGGPPVLERCRDVGVAWAGVAYSALIASVIGHGIFYWLVQRHPVSTITPYLLIAPVVAIVLVLALG